MRLLQQPRSRGEYRAGERRKAPLAPHVFMALYGAGWALAFEAGVRIYVAELVSVAGLLAVGWWGALQRYPVARSILGAYGLWVLAIFVSDIVNGTSLFDSARAASTPLIGGASFVFVLANVTRNAKSFLTFLAAIAIAKGIFGEPLFGEAFADMPLSMDSIRQDTNFFKVRIAPFLTPAFGLVACFAARKNLLLSALLFLVASAGYFSVDARSGGLVFFLSALVLVALHFRFRPTAGQMMAAGLAAAMIGYVAYLGYVNYTLTMALDGHNAKQLLRMSNVYNPFELILQGRSDWLVAADAASERPIFGYGSWAVDVNYKYTFLMLERAGIGWEGFWKTDRDVYLPVHSLILSTWVWSGLLGAAAMGWLGFVLIKSLAKAYVVTPLAPAIFLLSLEVLWHFFFSPPQSVRLFFSVPLAMLALMAQHAAALQPEAKSKLLSGGPLRAP